MERPVEGVRTAPTVAVPETMCLEVALAVMARARVRHLAVIDQEGCCAGVLSDRMLSAAWVWDPVTFPSRHVRDLTEHVIMPRHATVGAVASVMSERDCDAVAVVDDDGTAAGLVTTADLIAVIADASARTSADPPAQGTSARSPPDIRRGATRPG